MTGERLLNDEQIAQVLTEFYKPKGITSVSKQAVIGSDRAIAEAQHARTLKAVGEWLEGRGKAGMDALSKEEHGFWKGYWQARIDAGQALKEGRMP